MKPLLIIVRGLPGAGKSTASRGFIRDCLADFMFEADMYFERDGEYRFDATKLHEAHSWCQDQVRNALKGGLRVIVSNTSTTWKEIDVYLKIAQEKGADVHVVEVAGNYGSIHGVPESAMEKMRGRWLTGEDFMKLYRERYGDPGKRIYFIA